ncbi:hypothetical protein M422DRAFT_186569, partial [Sphaerobolus stellatus SS14]
NDGAYGGGVKIVLNCHLVIGSEKAQFVPPEVKRGVIVPKKVIRSLIILGRQQAQICFTLGIPRIAAIAGLYPSSQRASEMLLIGETISVPEAYSQFGFMNKAVPHAQVLPTAFEWAHRIKENSLDAVQETKRALILAQQLGNFEHATIANSYAPEARRADKGKNIKEGLRAFSETREPKWKNPTKL